MVVEMEEKSAHFEKAEYMYQYHTLDRIIDASVVSYYACLNLFPI